MQTFNFYTALTHLDEFFGIVLDDNEFETMGIHGWDKIGNKNVAIYHFKGTPQNGELDVPCNMDIIELITAGPEQYQKTDNIAVNNYSRLETESFIESGKSPGKALYSRGGMPSYNRVGDTLIFDNKHLGPVNIIYKGIILDEKGLPYLNFKEVEAIATYCAYVSTNKKAMMTKDKATFEVAQMLKQEWNRVCDNARTPTYTTQNEMNDILDAQSTWDRKRHGIAYKIYQ